MSNSKQQAVWNLGCNNQGSSQSRLSTQIRSEDNFHRFCENCLGVIPNLVLDKYNGIKCPHCHQPVENLDTAVGIFKRCNRCTSYLPCTSKGCYNCGIVNPFYDPNKPARLEKAMYMKMRAQVILDLEEMDRLTQDCVDDGEYGTMDKDVKADSFTDTSAPNTSVNLVSVTDASITDASVTDISDSTENDD